MSPARLLVWAPSNTRAGLQICALHCSLQRRHTFNDSAKSATSQVLEWGLLCCDTETCFLSFRFLALGHRVGQYQAQCVSILKALNKILKFTLQCKGKQSNQDSNTGERCDPCIVKRSKISDKK